MIFIPASRAVPFLTETRKRSDPWFSHNSGRKTAAHFSWNCSKEPHGSVEGLFFKVGCLPHLFKIVEVTHLGSEDVDDDIA
ncbi:hypothetical protein C1M53_13125 [Mesorhizobium sp. Pch-S]|nr:hypothetical protein C1M53_13125 [Mesorhizobium sp. Pch-S]